MDINDIRHQRNLQRELAIKLGQAVIDAIAAGLHPDNANAAVEEVWLAERRLEQSRRAFEKTYA
jgi:hypothetical protein